MVDKLNSMESSAPDKYMSRRYRLCKGGLIALVGVTVMGLYVSPGRSRIHCRWICCWCCGSYRNVSMEWS